MTFPGMHAVSNHPTRAATLTFTGSTTQSMPAGLRIPDPQAAAASEAESCSRSVGTHGRSGTVDDRHLPTSYPTVNPPAVPRSLEHKVTNTRPAAKLAPLRHGNITGMDTEETGPALPPDCQNKLHMFCTARRSYSDRADSKKVRLPGQPLSCRRPCSNRQAGK
jgi:hypothetical protein